MMDALEVAKAIGNGADPSGSFSDPLARAAEIAERSMPFAIFHVVCMLRILLMDPRILLKFVEALANLQIFSSTL